MAIYILLVGIVVAIVMFGCLKFGAEFCPPTVVIQHNDEVRLVRDGGGER